MLALPLVIAYDISSNRRRRRVHRILSEWRIDGQLSVHECRLTRTQAEELFLQLGEAIDPQTDSLLLAWLFMRRQAMARGRGSVAALTQRLHWVQ